MRGFDGALPGIAAAIAWSVVGLLHLPASAQDLGKLLESDARVGPPGSRSSDLERTLTPTDTPRNSVSALPGGGETATVKTSDDWTLVALRCRGTVTPPPGTATMPVILCDGLTYNVQFWNLDPSCSLAE